jgi:hypothetical protein
MVDRRLRKQKNSVQKEEEIISGFLETMQIVNAWAETGQAGGLTS